MEKRITKTNLKGKEVKMMKKLIYLMLLSLIIFGAGSAHAFGDFWTGSVWNENDGWVSNVRGFDWSSSGSGVAIGQGPYGSIPTVGDTFDFYYQAFLVGLTNPAGQPLTVNFGAPAPAIPDWQYTVVAKFPEIYTAVYPIPNGGGSVFATTGDPNDQSTWGTFYIYYDTNVNSNVLNGTGFDDGTLVASGVILPDQSSFFNANLITGIGNGSGTIEGLVNFADPNYFDIASIIFDFRFEGTINYPPLDSNANAYFLSRAGEGNYAPYTVLPGDLRLKVDGSSKFSQQVPEPSTLLLLGTGLLGLGGYARRRMKK